MASRNVWGRFGYLDFRCWIRVFAQSTSDSVLSSSDIGSLMNDQDVLVGDLPPNCLTIFSLQASTAASNLLMLSRASCSDLKFRDLSISSGDLCPEVKTLYSSSPKFALPDCKYRSTKIVELGNYNPSIGFTGDVWRDKLNAFWWILRGIILNQMKINLLVNPSICFNLST